MRPVSFSVGRNLFSD